MKFIMLTVKEHAIIHGFDENNQEILEHTATTSEFTKKLFSIDRIKSVTPRFILTDYAQGRLVLWEYQESFDILTEQLQHAGLILNIAK